MGMNGAAGPPLGGAPADADRAFLEHLVDKMNACKEAEAIDFMTVEKCVAECPWIRRQLPSVANCLV